jgi:hypothetical protein
MASEQIASTTVADRPSKVTERASMPTSFNLERTLKPIPVSSGTIEAQTAGKVFSKA